MGFAIRESCTAMPLLRFTFRESCTAENLLQDLPDGESCTAVG